MPSDNSSNEHTGGCYCGDVRYTVTGNLEDFVVCHCSQCRKQSGHLYATTIVTRDRVTIVGEHKLTWFRASETAQRAFCTCCGSHLFWLGEDGSHAILAASLDHPTGLSIREHIFVADKGDYYEIEDGAPQHDAYP